MMELKELIVKKREVLFKKEYGRAPVYAKAVTHRLTPYLVFYFAKWGLTPNQVTLLSLIAGLLSCAIFIFFSGSWILLAVFFLELYYVLDSVDGQLARYTEKFSKSGSFFDVLGNYILHPLVFLSIGMNQYFESGEGWVVFLASLSAFSYMWLTLIWEVRGNLIFQWLKKGGVSLKARDVSADAEKELSVFARIFSVAHKLCTYPTLMNVITIVAILEFMLGDYLFYSPILWVYAILLPFVSLAKIGKMVLSGEIDREYQSYQAP